MTAVTRGRLLVMLPLLLLLQTTLVVLAVWPQVSARTTGEEIRVRVRPVDPIDPFRGAYVRLSYPDLRQGTSRAFDGGQGSMEDGESGPVYISLREEGGVWVADDWSRRRPSEGTYLSCSDRSWQITCGIESLFLPQDEAKAMERQVAGGDAVATLKVDGRGNAALIEVSAP